MSDGNAYIPLDGEKCELKKAAFKSSFLVRCSLRKSSQTFVVPLSHCRTTVPFLWVSFRTWMKSACFYRFPWCCETMFSADQSLSPTRRPVSHEIPACKLVKVGSWCGHVNVDPQWPPFDAIHFCWCWAHHSRVLRPDFFSQPMTWWWVYPSTILNATQSHVLPLDFQDAPEEVPGHSVFTARSKLIASC